MFAQTPLALFAALSLFSGVAVSQTCKVQSCDIADASGSTGRDFDGTKLLKLEGVTDDGRKCIEQNYYALNLPIPRGYSPTTKPPATYAARTDWYVPPKRARSLRRTLAETEAEELSARSEAAEAPADLEERQLPGLGCKPKTLIWARGTLDPPLINNMGVIIGPAVQGGLDSAQPNQWNTIGVEYSADFAGIFCVGMPGSVSCKNLINSEAKRCPQTKFVVAGYSQGGMIAHGCVAFADPDVRARVAGVVAFGDPFNGAPIRDYPASKVKTICDANDGVCGGRLDISLFHFAYSAGDAGTQAVNWILKQV